MQLTADACRAARALLGWSMRDLAERASLSLGAVNRLESGDTASQGRTRERIEAAFAAHGVELIRAEDDGPSLALVFVPPEIQLAPEPIGPTPVLHLVERGEAGEPTFVPVERGDWERLSPPTSQVIRPGPGFAASKIRTYLEEALERAEQILEQTGLEPDCPAFVFRDQAGSWWAYSYDQQEVISEPGRRACHWIDPATDAPDDLPTDFAHALGGEGGPLDWAFAILKACRELAELDALKQRKGEAGFYPGDMDWLSGLRGDYWDGFRHGLQLKIARQNQTGPQKRTKLLHALLEEALRRYPDMSNEALAAELVRQQQARTGLGLRLRPLNPGETRLARHIGQVRRGHLRS